MAVEAAEVAAVKAIAGARRKERACWRGCASVRGRKAYLRFLVLILKRFEWSF